MSGKPVLLSWSGGKDSCMALHMLQRSSTHRVTGLLTTVTQGAGRVSIHGVRVELLRAQAAALGLPLDEVAIPAGAGNDAYEQAVGAALRRHVATGVRTVAFGDLFLADIRSYREAMVARHGMAATFPVWGHDTRRFVGEFIALGCRGTLVCVDVQALDESFAGRAIDADLLRDLPPEVDPCGENGEYHSFAHDGPMFGHPVAVAQGARTMRDGFCFCDMVPGKPVVVTPTGIEPVFQP